MSIVASSAYEFPAAVQDAGSGWPVRQLILDLHDGPIQYLSAALMQLELLNRALERVPAVAEPARATAGLVQQMIERAAVELRGLVGAAAPVDVSGVSLSSLLGGVILQHEALTGRPVDYEVADSLPEPEPAARLTLYRVLQEALSNVRRHSGALWTSVQLGSIEAAGRHEFWLVVEDEGCGFDLDSLPASGHLGLTGMRERMEAVGGRLTVWSTLGAGTMVRASLFVP